MLDALVRENLGRGLHAHTLYGGLDCVAEPCIEGHQSRSTWAQMSKSFEPSKYSTTGHAIHAIATIRSCTGLILLVVLFACALPWLQSDGLSSLHVPATHPPPPPPPHPPHPPPPLHPPPPSTPSPQKKAKTASASPSSYNCHVL